MPPKNKGKSKKSPKARTPTLINGLTKEEMSKEQLEEYIVNLREELDREREERNFFQLERDKIYNFWKITDKQLEELKAEQKNLDKDIEDDEGRHQVEIKVYKQKMKHLLCEHQNTISELKAHRSVCAGEMQKEQRQLESGLHQERRSIMVDAQEFDDENLVQELELKHDEEMSQTRDTWEKQLAEIKAKYDKKLALLPEELENLRRTEMSGREDHWNSHIAALIDGHSKAFGEANAFVVRMQEDVDVNRSLKKQIKDMKMTQKQKEKDQAALLQDNKSLAELLLKVKEEIAENQKKISQWEIKKDTSEKLKKKELKDLNSDYEALEQKFSELQLERDELYQTFARGVQRVQDQGSVKADLLETKLRALTDGLEETQAQLSSVIAASNMDQTALRGVTEEIETNLDFHNNSMKNLKFQKAQTLKAQKDLLLTYEAKKMCLGVAAEDTCVKPAES